MWVTLGGRCVTNQTVSTGIRLAEPVSGSAAVPGSAVVLGSAVVPDSAPAGSTEVPAISAWTGDPHGEVDHPVPNCPVEVTLRALRGRWTTLVVRELFAGEWTFGDLAATLPALSDKVLSDRLAQLVAAGVVARVREPGWPSRVRYSLTARGRALRGVLEAMWAWGSDAAGATGAGAAGVTGAAGAGGATGVTAT
jgi:DNA-binding HxlR family transcriptional regulator